MHRIRLWSALIAAVCTVPVAPAAAEPSGSFTAIAAPFPYPEWNDTGHRCNAGVEPLNKTAQTFTAPADGLLTVSTTGFIGDWDLFITDTAGVELLASNRPQDVTSIDGSEQTTIMLAVGDIVRIVACNQLGAPVTQVSYAFDLFTQSTIAAAVGVADAGGENTFSPQTVTITAGQAVAWRRVAGDQPHTVTGDNDSFRGGTVLRGTFARTFDTPGVYYYFCEYHGLQAPVEDDRIGQWGKVIVTSS